MNFKRMQSNYWGSALLFAICGAMGLVGCGMQAATESHRANSGAGNIEQPADPVLTVERGAGLTEMRAGDVTYFVQTEEPLSSSSPQSIDRRIIYEATVNLVVEDFEQAEIDLPKLVQEYGGYLADARFDRTSGEQRTGHWQIRIPVARFEEFLVAIDELGVAEGLQRTAQDVTEEFVDLTARIENHQRLEQRIVKLLDESFGKISELIEVERELARVRGEIEQMEGRLRYLTNRTDLTTVTVHVREERDYVPPAAPSFAAQIGQAWRGSFDSLKEFGQNLTLIAVYATPWIVLWVLVALPVIWLVRLARRRLAHQSAGYLN